MALKDKLNSVKFNNITSTNNSNSNSKKGKVKHPKITASHIEDLLTKRHLEDVAIPQCKTGSSSGKFSIFDYWVMKKSWASPLTVGYEIKVSRQDFLGDSKWTNYLPFCNELYFICPAKLIDVNEVPEGVGLMWVSSTGKRIYTKKKAKYRNVNESDINHIYKYIMMSRIEKYNRSRYIDQEGSGKGLAYWKAFYRDKEDAQNFGREQGNKIAKLVREGINNKERENYKLNKELEALGELKKFISKEFDIDNLTYYNLGRVKEKMKESGKGISSSVVRLLETVHEKNNELYNSLIKLVDERE